MADFSLKAEPFLGSYHKNFGALSLSEVTDRAIFSLAIPLGLETEVSNKIKSEFDINTPAIGRAAETRDGLITMLRLGVDQLFCFIDSEQETNRAHAEFSSRLGGCVYTTDQSDVWVSLMLSGNEVRKVLERICPIDLHPSKFTVSCFARTVMEHLGTIVYHHSDNGFTLMSASSSAKSFLHAIETSIENVMSNYSG